MAIKDWNGFKKNGDTYIPNDATARTGLQNKVDKVTGKGLSTNDYDNTAKGIVDNIHDNVIANTKLIKDTVGWSGKNKCPRFLNFSQGNVVFTVDGNGVVDITTSAAVLSNAWNIIDTNLPVFENGKKYKVSGLGTSTNQDGYVVGDDNGTDYVYVHDIGNGGEFTYDSSKPLKKIQIGLRSGQTASHIKLSPMIYNADILDSTYEPYFGSTAFPRSEQAVLGAKNLLPYPFDVSEGETIANVTYTSDDGVVTLNGTSNASSVVAIKPRMPHNNNEVYIPIGKYKFVINSNLQGLVRVQVAKTYNGRESVFASSTGTEVEFEITSDFLSDYKKSDGSVLVGFQIGFDSGKAFNNTKIYPMLLVAEDTDRTFARYAMTNRELTEKAQGIINAAINATDFASFKTALGNL